MEFQFPVESFIRSIPLEIFKLLPCLDAHEPSPAVQNISQLPPTLFSVGDAELVKVSGIWFKLGDVPCIFGEYSVEDAILLGDPIPESTECGWILFWPPTAEGPLTLDSWPFAAVELLIDVEPVNQRFFMMWKLKAQVIVRHCSGHITLQCLISHVHVQKDAISTSIMDNASPQCCHLKINLNHHIMEKSLS